MSEFSVVQKILALHQRLPEGHCDIQTFLLQLATFFGDIETEVPEYTRLAVTSASMICNNSVAHMQENGYTGPVLPWKSFVGEVLNRLSAEYSEPGEHAGVTYAEIFDSIWGAMRAGYGTVLKAYGSRFYLVWQSVADTFGRIAMLLGESLGPGEKTPRGAAGSGSGGWSIGG